MTFLLVLKKKKKYLKITVSTGLMIFAQVSFQSEEKLRWIYVKVVTHLVQLLVECDLLLSDHGHLPNSAGSPGG